MAAPSSKSCARATCGIASVPVRTARTYVRSGGTAGSYTAWAETRTIIIARMLAFLEEIRVHAVFDVATLSVALRELRSLT